MTEPLSPEQAFERIDRAVGLLIEAIPELENIYEAFRPILAEQAAIKAGLSPVDFSDFEIDPERYTSGVPLLEKDAFKVSPDAFRSAAERLIPAMAASFPMMEDRLQTLNKAIRDSSEADSPAIAVVLGNDGDAQRVADNIGITVELLQFAVGLIVKPFAENRAESLPPMPEDLQWLKGYCPVCGSWPELSYLEGKEGRRWLRCSFCGHEWSFARIQCPFCETKDHEKLEMVFQEGREHERAELCHECMKYVVGIDLRDRIDGAVHETAALGMVYLDMLAQQKGFTPGATCGWNVVSGR